MNRPTDAEILKTLALDDKVEQAKVKLINAWGARANRPINEFGWHYCQSGKHALHNPEGSAPHTCDCPAEGPPAV